MLHAFKKTCFKEQLGNWENAITQGTQTRIQQNLDMLDRHVSNEVTEVCNRRVANLIQNAQCEVNKLMAVHEKQLDHTKGEEHFSSLSMQKVEGQLNDLIQEMIGYRSRNEDLDSYCENLGKMIPAIQEQIKGLKSNAITSDQRIKDWKFYLKEEIQMWTVKIENKIEDITKALGPSRDKSPLSTSNCPSGLDGKQGMC